MWGGMKKLKAMWYTTITTRIHRKEIHRFILNLVSISAQKLVNLKELKMIQACSFYDSKFWFPIDLHHFYIIPKKPSYFFKILALAISLHI